MSDIAVLIPHFNNLVGLKKALDSISDLQPVDIIIVDDGSTKKPSLKALKELYTRFDDIHVLYSDINQGIEHALNIGLRYIKVQKKYNYIARLDCGDVCHPDRFKVQKSFLENNPDVYLVGAWADVVDMDGAYIFSIKHPTNHRKIKKGMFINSMFVHVSVMFRTEIINKIGYYPLNYKYAEDYAYFFKIVNNFVTGNIDCVLVTCEANPNGISLLKRRQQIKSRIAVIYCNFTFAKNAFWGLFRNVLLLATPYRCVFLIKKFIMS